MPNGNYFRQAKVESYSHDSTAAAVERLTALVEAQARTIRQYEASIAHSRYIFEHASAAARLGLWECDLVSETLNWSDGTYDLFDLPRGSPLVRAQTLKCYPEESLKALEYVRTRAIQERKGFSLDAMIVTPTARRRWIRIHATVECAGDKPLRLFGIKQDVTDEKALLERTRYRAEYDEMTGLANRGQFRSHLSQACRNESGESAAITLLLVDLDGFKNVNDSRGHAVGDACLTEAARRLKSVCREASLVARIGGDEFAVILQPPCDGKAATFAADIIAAIGRPIECNGQWFTIGASIGIATAESGRPHEIFKHADAALYAAKAGGRNTYRVFSPAAVKA